MVDPLWTFAEIASALGTASPGPGDTSLSGVSIDSRTLAAGDLFVAIKGERNDGHAFVRQALEQGAAAAVVSEAVSEAVSGAEGCAFCVADTLEALNALGGAARARTDARIAAVTGSVGKTGTKEMLRTMLSALAPTHVSDKSYNNLWGVPLSLARMPRGAKFGVFEIGMNHAGEITPLARLVRPHLAVITWVAPVHIEFFGSVAEIADAKAEIFEGLDRGGHAILPLDNEHFARLAAHAKRKGLDVVTFGETAGAHARLLDLLADERGSWVSADVMGTSLAFRLPAPGRHLAANAIASLAAVKLLGGDVTVAADALAGFETPEGRGRRASFETPQGAVLVIDETYNANPASMRAALEVLGSLPRHLYARRIAVLGDMLELGHYSPQFHAELASAVDSCGIDLVFCCGPLMQNLYERLPLDRRGGAAPSSDAIGPLLIAAVRGGDAVMLKGSLGSKMRPLADALRTALSARQPAEAGRRT